MKSILLGTILLALIGTACAAPFADITFDIQAGTITSILSSYDTSTLHPGALGEQNTLTAFGGFKGTETASHGSYGAQSTYVNLNGFADPTYAPIAGFGMKDVINYDITSGNWNTGVVGTFNAQAGGTASAASTQNVGMNLKSVGSMYVWGEATNPYSQPCLQGQLISKELTTTQGSTTLGDLYLGVQTDGVAGMTNSNIWGWGSTAQGQATTNYAGGTRNVFASGAGNVVQDGSGLNSLQFNTYNFPAGGSWTSFGTFTNGMTGTYTMTGQ